MTTKAKVDAARDLWLQARRATIYEHRALSLLVAARKETIENYDNILVERAARTGSEQYRKQLGHHVARVQVALEHLDKMATSFDTAQAQWREAERGRASAAVKPPVIYTATVLQVGKK